MSEIQPLVTVILKDGTCLKFNVGCYQEFLKLRNQMCSPFYIWMHIGKNNVIRRSSVAFIRYED